MTPKLGRDLRQSQKDRDRDRDRTTCSPATRRVCDRERVCVRECGRERELKSGEHLPFLQALVARYPEP